MGTEAFALAAMAHELRTPITAILGYSELLQGRIDADASQYACALIEAAQTLGATVDAMLDYSRIRRGEMTLAEGLVDLPAIVAGAARLVTPSADRRRIRITTRFDDGASSVRGDERLLRQLLSNLLVNAVRYGAEDSRILVAAHLLPGGALEIRVEDAGIGIAEEDLERAFLPFDRLGRACDGNAHASGIGLPLSRAIGELHGGTVRLESRVGVGTTAIVRLPPGRVSHCSTQRQESFDFAYL